MKEIKLMQFFKTQGIRAKILTGYTSMFVLTSILGGLIIYFQVKNTITKNIQDELNNSTSAVLNMVKTAANVSIKNYLRAVCDKNKENIQAIYNRYMSGEISEIQAKDEVRRVIFSQTIGKTGYIYCVNSLGIPVQHPNPDVAGKKIWAEQPFVKQMIKMKHGYMEYDWKNPGETVYRPKAIYMSYFEPWDWILSVSTYTDELKDLINVNDFRHSVLALKFGKTGYSFILDGKGNIIVHPELEVNQLEGSSAQYRDSLKEKMIKLKTGKLVYLWKNAEDDPYRQKMVIFNYIPEYDWIVASSGYLDEFYSVLGTVKKICMIGIFFMLGFALLTSFWLSSLIIKPLNQLMVFLGMGVPQNLTTRLPVTSNDEIGKLVTYFNGFMKKLETYSNNLKKEVSEHRLTAEALMESEWRNRTILKCIHEGYFEADLKGNISFSNHSLSMITGYSREALRHKNILHITSDKDQKNMSDIFDGNGLKEQNIGIFEWELKRIDDQPCFVETSLSTIANNVSNQAGIRGVVRDVTQRIQAQKALLLSEEMFSKAFQSSPCGMFVADIENGRLINVNDSFLTFTGYDKATVLGKEMLNLDFFKNENEGKKFFKLINEKKSLRNKEIEFCRISGDVRDGMISAEVIQIWGETCILAALVDYTETKKLERQFLEMTERQRREIAFALHDDLCPQLIGIELLIGILHQKLKKTLPAQVDSIEKIELLVQDSIRKTRLLSRGLCPVDIINQGFDASLSELVGYVEDMFGVVCHLDCDGSSPFTGNTAATHAYYIAHEAVHNAVKHADAKKITIHFSTHKNKIVLMVKDDGKGIENQTNHKGLGLKIMEYRAQLLNATLDIRRSVRGETIVLLEMDGPVIQKTNV
ncbi:cache domain-containing protein [Desulfoprunum benzoelyticum]|uniref:histidine kinase n=1 Tax=Desulfoprunum benzoelyticum TaxID=1506996 RepID=A0A840V143_9BACT|nr:cache domain-containing protein [Desulfoprunum benzoelyticum]MBB5349394.1 PAS domain S-box-containing protein [Desulfoprunum benzoelyticum]MBM9531180.1 cache domain-containing protein [Desulfoprunum benzoelyticum]